MKKFRVFLEEEFQAILILEARADDFANRWMKLRADHQLVKSNPALARQMMKHAFTLGQTPDEHEYIVNQYLNGTLQPKEHDDTIRETLGLWRKAVDRNLHGGKKLSQFDHDSVQQFFAGIPDLQKSKKLAGVARDLAPYHIGQVEHPEFGKLDVFHIQENNVRETHKGKTFKEYEKFSNAMKSSCKLPGSTVCVQHSPTHVRNYSAGHGFFAYLDEDGIFRMGHGNGEDLVYHDNHQVVNDSPDERNSIIDQTHRLIKDNTHRLLYRLKNQPDKVSASEIQNNIAEHDEILSHVLYMPSSFRDKARQATILTPDTVKKLLHSDKISSPYKNMVIQRVATFLPVTHSTWKTPPERGDKNLLSDWHHDYLDVLKDPKLHKKLLEKGQLHTLFRYLPDSTYRSFGMTTPENHVNSIVSSFINWKPEDIMDEVAKARAKDPDSMLEKEKDMKALISQNPDALKLDDVEHMLDHPNFSVQHGRMVHYLMHRLSNQVSDDEMETAVGDRAHEHKHILDRWKNIAQRALDSNIPDLHTFVLENEEGPLKFMRSMVTPKYVTKIMNDAAVHANITSPLQQRDGYYGEGTHSDILGAILAGHPQMTKAIQRRIASVDELHDDSKPDHISSLIHSNNEEAKLSFLRRLPALQNGTFYREMLNVRLSPTEVEKLATSPSNELRHESLSMKHFPDHLVDSYLTNTKNPMLARMLIMKEERQNQLTTEHLDRAWDAHKVNIPKMFKVTTENDHYRGMSGFLSALLNHDKVSERVKEEALKSSHPRVLIHAINNITKPEHITNILETYKRMPSNLTVPQSDTAVTDTTMLMKDIFGSKKQEISPLNVQYTQSNFAASHNKKLSSIRSHLRPEHLRDFAVNANKIFYAGRGKNPENSPWTSIDVNLLTDVYAHPLMPTDVLEKHLSIIQEDPSSLMGMEGNEDKFYEDILEEHGIPTKMSDSFDAIQKGIISNPNLPEHILSHSIERNMSYKDTDHRVYENLNLVAPHPKVKGQNLDKLVDLAVEPVKDEITNIGARISHKRKILLDRLTDNPNLEDHHIVSLVTNSTQADHHVDEILSNKSVAERISGDTITTMLKLPEHRFSNSHYTRMPEVFSDLSRNPKLSERHLTDLMSHNASMLDKDYEEGHPVSNVSKIGANAFNYLLNPNSNEQHISHFIDTVLEQKSHRNRDIQEVLAQSLIAGKPRLSGRAASRYSANESIEDGKIVYRFTNLGMPLHVTSDELKLLHSKVTPEHIDALHNMGYSVVSSPHLQDRHIDQILDSYDKDQEKIDKVSQGRDPSYKTTIANLHEDDVIEIAKRPNLKPEHRERISKLKSYRYDFSPVASGLEPYR